jgi:hypothetical protein
MQRLNYFLLINNIKIEEFFRILYRFSRDIPSISDIRRYIEQPGYLLLEIVKSMEKEKIELK